MKNHMLGQLGEDYAIKFINTQNQHLITRNYHCRLGEIDLISFDYSIKEIAFIEVKTRTSHTFGTCLESITHHKQKRLIKAALMYLQSHQFSWQFSWRIDLISVELGHRFLPENISYLKHILDG